MQLGQAVLPRAEEVAGPAQAQVLLGYFEAVVYVRHGRKPLLRLGVFRVRDEDAVALVPAAADAPAQLVELAQAEALGVLDYHQRRVRDVDADLYDRRGDEHVCLAGGEAGHYLLAGLGLHLPVDALYAQAGQGAAELKRVLLGGDELLHRLGVGLYGRADDEDLPALAGEPGDEAVEPFAVRARDREGVHPLPAGRELVYERDVEVAVDDKREGARYGRRAHDQHMGPLALGLERGALRHAEAVLLVGDDEAQALELHALAYERVGADGERGLAGGEGGAGLALGLRAHGAGELDYLYPEGREKAAERGVMLLRQQLGRGHEGALEGVFRREPYQGRGDERLARADVALHKAVHEPARAHILRAVGDCAQLRARRREGQGGGEGGEIAPLEGDAGLRLALAADKREGADQREELLEHQPLPREGQGVRAAREVDVLVGIARRAQPVPPRRLRGQGLRHVQADAVEHLAHGPAYVALVYPAREPVDGHDAAREAAGLVLGLYYRVGEGEAPAEELRFAVEDIALAPAELLPEPALVEDVDEQRARGVRDAEAQKFLPAAEPAQLRLRHHHGAHAGRLALAEVRDGLYDAAVLVGAREEAQKLPGPVYAEAGEGLRLGLAYALEIAHVYVRIEQAPTAFPAHRPAGARLSYARGDRYVKAQKAPHGGYLRKPRGARLRHARRRGNPQNRDRGSEAGRYARPRQLPRGAHHVISRGGRTRPRGSPPPQRSRQARRRL